MRFGFVFAGEKARAFQHHVNSQFTPGQFFRIRFGKYRNFFAVHDQFVAFQLNFALKAALSGVVFKQMRQHVGRGQIVDGNDFNTFCLYDAAQCQTADAAKSINRYFNAHCVAPFR